jgi:hypothetical protein
MGLGKIGRCDPVTVPDGRDKEGISYSSDMILARDSLAQEAWSPRLGIADNGYRRPSQRIGFLADSNTPPLPPPPPSPPPSFHFARRLLEQQTSTAEILTMAINLPPTEPQAPNTTTPIREALRNLFQDNEYEVEVTTALVADYFRVKIHIDEGHIIISDGNGKDRDGATSFTSWWMGFAALTWRTWRSFPNPCHLLGDDNVRNMFV